MHVDASGNGHLVMRQNATITDLGAIGKVGYWSNLGPVVLCERI
jgi:hypothetical protein